MNSKILSQFLNQAQCYQCGNSLKEAKVVPLADSRVAGLVYVVCSHCSSELLATLSVGGHNIQPLNTDLVPWEVKRFFGARPVEPDDVLNVHELVKEETLWSTLKQENEKYSEKRQNSYAEKATSRLSLKEEGKNPSHLL